MYRYANFYFAKIDNCDTKKLRSPLKKWEAVIQKYTPGYKIVIYPSFEDGRISIMIRVKG